MPASVPPASGMLTFGALSRDSGAPPDDKSQGLDS